MISLLVESSEENINVYLFPSSAKTSLIGLSNSYGVKGIKKRSKRTIGDN